MMIYEIALRNMTEIEHLLQQSTLTDNMMVINNSLIQSRQLLLKLQDMVLATDKAELLQQFNTYAKIFDKYNDEALRFINQPLFHDYGRLTKQLDEFIICSDDLKAIVKKSGLVTAH
ncbi:hypothetical protein MK904_13265 [Loigolactobacillus coryniformis]|jgi:hypothetical protein|uniref:hypothetical protein n=1 Tax=Loigolactobacillus coryniformis TaxID=1610 RepID=UPI00031FBA5E|nr:hypothetical protein [Loigolactobacillus coryniformis]MBW4803820.1 hypothetical protein [Loigolactobacillus coryniformis subsp. torquens]MBW4806516.1 hypothetical protein [Loigolactobacillus coryniformis subsp. torquens]MDC4187041.1 hypothetical protein [Loigolactobacillus coryniformis]